MSFIYHAIFTCNLYSAVFCPFPSVESPLHINVSMKFYSHFCSSCLTSSSTTVERAFKNSFALQRDSYDGHSSSGISMSGVLSSFKREIIDWNFDRGRSSFTIHFTTSSLLVAPFSFAVISFSSFFFFFFSFFGCAGTQRASLWSCPATCSVRAEVLKFLQPFCENGFLHPASRHKLQNIVPSS